MTEVVLVSREDCGYCDHAKQVLAAVGSEFAFEVRELDERSEAARSLIARSGVFVTMAPVVFLDGEFFAQGRLSERKLRKTLRPRDGRQIARSRPE